MSLKYSHALFVFLFVTCSQNCWAQKVIAKPLPDNPTIYIFKTDVQTLQTALKYSCSRYNSFKFSAKLSTYYPGIWAERYWPYSSKYIAKQMDKKYDIYLEVSTDSSDIYFNKKGIPFGYEVECIVHFTSLNDNSTRVEIKTLGARAHVRNELLPRPPHFVNNPVYKRVSPTTIEEYKVLQYIGRSTGVLETMPVLKL